MKNSSIARALIFCVFLSVCACARGGESVSVARLTEQATRMLRRHEYAAALETVNRALEIDPVYIPLWRVKAAAHIALKQHEEARETIDVCLLRDPDDIDAHILGLQNALERGDIDRTDRVRELSALLRSMAPDMLAGTLTAYIRRGEFPENVAILLEAWQRTDSPLDAARAVLAAYSGNHLREAAELAAGEAMQSLPPELTEALRNLVAQARDSRSAVWAADLGELAEGDNGELRLAAAPGSGAIARLRMSAGWRDVFVSIDSFDAGETRKTVYLRYRSPESYLRVAVDRESVLVQERVPGSGLSTLEDIPAADLKGEPLRLILRGGRLEIYAGTRALTDGGLPVSGPISEGRVALGCENRTDVRTEAVFGGVEVSRIEPKWLFLTGAESREAAAEMFRANDVTGVLFDLGGAAPKEALPSLLLAAANAGLSACALLPEGSLDFRELQKPLAKLPKVLAARIWDAVATRLSDNTDFEALEVFFANVKGRGLESGLYVTPDAARRLAGYGGDLYVDRLLIKGGDALPGSLLGALGKFCGEEIHLP